jgi:hypothetical protein
MPPNKHSFALVLEDFHEQKKQERKRRLNSHGSPLSRDKDGYTNEPQGPSSVEDEFYLDPVPSRPRTANSRHQTAARHTSNKPLPGSWPEWSRPLSPPSSPPRKSKQRPANISIPSNVAVVQRQFPPPPSPSSSPAVAAVGLESQKHLPPPALPSPALASPRSYSRLEHGTRKGTLYNVAGYSKSSVSISEVPRLKTQASASSFSHFTAKASPPPSSDRMSENPVSSTGLAKDDFGIKKNVNLSLAQFLREVEAEDSQRSPISAAPPPASASNSAPRTMSNTGNSAADPYLGLRSPTLRRVPSPLVASSLDRAQPENLPDLSSPLTDEAVPPPIIATNKTQHNGKALAGRFRNDTSPRSVYNDQAPEDIRTGAGTTTQPPTHSALSSPRFRFFQGLNTLRSFGKKNQDHTQQQQQQQQQGGNPRKDSSSVSSYHAKSRSTPTSRPTSRDSSPTSIGTRRSFSSGLAQEHVAQSGTAPAGAQARLRVLEPDKLTAEHLFLSQDRHDDFHLDSEVATPRAATPADTLPALDTALYSEDSTSIHDPYDLDAGNFDTPTDTDFTSDADQQMDAELETLTDVSVSTEAYGPISTHADRSLASLASSSSMPASIITTTDLSAAPPFISGDIASSRLQPMQTISHRSSEDSVAPPPISLSRREKDRQSAAKGASSFGSGFGLLRRVNSKPPAKPRAAKSVTSGHDIEEEKRQRMAELELLTRSVPYEKAVRGQRPFTNKAVAEAYPARRHQAFGATHSHTLGTSPGRTTKDKRPIGQGLREEQILLAAMEDTQWRENMRRARQMADREYLRALEEMSAGNGGHAGSAARSRRGSLSGGLGTISES